MSLYDSTGLYDQASLTYNGGAGGVAGLPTIGVFIGFDDSPYVSNPNWTEITPYVRNVPSIRRARSDDWSTFTGSAALTLNNRDQRFNPYNTSSPYYGKLLPRRQIKIVAQSGEYTNLITNPSFEGSLLTGWSGSFSTRDYYTPIEYVGAGCMRITSTAAFATCRANTPNFITIQQGKTYTASAYAYTLTGSDREMGMSIEWYDSLNNSLGTTIGQNITVQQNAIWKRLSVTGVSPANAATCVVSIFSQLTNGAIGNQALFDAAMLHEGLEPLPYFDGNTSGGRWTGTANASTSVTPALLPLFRGYIAGWPVEWSNNDEDSIVDIECYDALSLLADTLIPNDVSYSVIQNLTPIHWFRGDDADRSKTIQNIGSRGLAAIGAQPLNPAAVDIDLTKVDQLAPGLPFKADSVYSNTLYNTPSVASPPVLSNISFTSWYSVNDTQNFADIPIFEFFSSTTSCSVGIVIQSDGFIRVGARRGSTSYTTTSTVGGFSNTEKHHVAMSLSGTTLKLYIDGRDTTGTVTTGTAINPGLVEYFSFRSVVFQDCSVFDYALTATQIKAIYDAGNAEIIETTSSRVLRLLSNGLFPTSLVSTPVSPKGTVSEITTGEAQLVNEFNLVKDSEGGELYVSKEGVVTFTERNSQLTGRSATTQAYFKDDGTALKYAGNFVLRFDADSLVNDLRYDITGDTVVTATDSASISTYGRSSKTVNTQLSTAVDAQTLANSRLAIFDLPIPDVSPLQVGITRSLADWRSLLALEVLDQIEVVRTPKVGSVFADRLLINEISHSISPEEWSMQVTGSARFSEWFTIGIDSIGGDRLIA